MRNRIILILAAVLSLSVKAQAADITFDQRGDATGIVQDIQNADWSGPIPEPMPTDQGGESIVRDMDYSFGLNVVRYDENGREITKVEDPENNFLLLVARNAYGDYAVKLTVDDGDAAFDIRKVDQNQYLIRSEEVNLTVKRDVFGGYYDISGDVPTPVGDTLSMRLNIRNDDTLTASDSGYDLALGRVPLLD